MLTVAIVLTTISLALMWAPPAAHAQSLPTERNAAGPSSATLFAPRTLTTIIHGGSMTPATGHAVSAGVSHSIYPSPISRAGGTPTQNPGGFKVMKHCSMGPHDNRLKD